MAAAQRHTGSSFPDGTPRCTACGRRNPEGIGWCPVVSGLLCAACCDGAVRFDPATMVEVLSLTELALTPAEVADACRDCQRERAPDVGVRRDGDPPLPS